MYRRSVFAIARACTRRQRNLRCVFEQLGERQLLAAT